MCLAKGLAVDAAGHVHTAPCMTRCLSTLACVLLDLRQYFWIPWCLGGKDISLKISLCSCQAGHFSRMCTQRLGMQCGPISNNVEQKALLCGSWRGRQPLLTTMTQSTRILWKVPHADCARHPASALSVSTQPPDGLDAGCQRVVLACLLTA